LATSAPYVTKGFFSISHYYIYSDLHT